MADKEHPYRGDPSAMLTEACTCGHTNGDHHYFNSEFIGCLGAGMLREIRGQPVAPMHICECRGWHGVVVPLQECG